jgi:adenylate cyclase
MFKYALGIPSGALLPDAVAQQETADAMQVAERCSEDFALHMAQLTRGIIMVAAESGDRKQGFNLLDKARSAAIGERFILTAVPTIDLQTAVDRARSGDLDGAVELSRRIIDQQFETGAALDLGATTSVLVESLLRRGRPADLNEARIAIDTLAAVPADPGYVFYELPLLRMRALLASAQRDDGAYRTYADRYFAMAQALQFEGHLATARAMKQQPTRSPDPK